MGTISFLNVLTRFEICIGCDRISLCAVCRMELSDSNVFSKSTNRQKWLIVVVVVVIVVILALGLGLGIYYGLKQKEHTDAGKCLYAR